MGLWSSFFLPRKVVAACLSEVQTQRDVVKRLEIRVRELELSVESIDEAQMRLAKRQAGRSGGRPVGTGASTAQLDSLDHIPVGDKAALRAHFAPQLAARTRGEPTREQ